MPNPLRAPKFNASARKSSVGGSRKKGKAKRAAAGSVPTPEIADPNVEIVMPKSKEEREQERKERLRQELESAPESKMTSRKRKRLDKYIEKKLKQQDRVLVLEKLAKSQAEVDPTAFRTSATLGAGHTRTHAERAAHAEHHEVRRALAGRAGRRRREPGAMDVDGDDEESADEDEEPVARAARTPPRRASPAPALPGAPAVFVDDGSGPVPAPSAPAPPTVGAALRRNADGSVAAPRVIPRKPRDQKTAFRAWGRGSRIQPAQGADSDTSFDSSDSAGDTDTGTRAGATRSADADSDMDSEASWSGCVPDAQVAGVEDNDNDASDGSDDQDAGSTDGSDDGTDNDEPEPEPARKRVGFKAWAQQQLSQAKGYVAPPIAPSPPDGADELLAASAPPQAEHKPAPARPAKRRRLSASPEPAPGLVRGPLGAAVSLPATALAARFAAGPAPAPAAPLTLHRPADVQEARLLLPVVAEEQAIVEAVRLHPVVVVVGETGSGKTTQVPQFLLEAGLGASAENPGMIGITQPRRVAAMAMAARVAHELGLPGRVAYQVRYDATTSAGTALKFMTDGVLLRELAGDFLLAKYAVLIVDEAHERSLNTDILLGVLSRVVRLREQMWKDGKDMKPLRLVIMSATLRVADFAENPALFAPAPPVLAVGARQHPVTVHFARRTAPDYVAAATTKAARIHARLPPGGILVFLTGQNEITGVCRALEARFGRRAIEERKRRRAPRTRRPIEEERDEDEPVAIVAPAHADVEVEDLDLGGSAAAEVASDVDEGQGDSDPEDLESDGDDALDKALGIDAEESEAPMHIVPLYSLLPAEKQMKVFEPPPEGSRLVVVATNVAETSLTIPGIRYVVDCGRAKERQYDSKSGIQTFQVGWISKASAAQRAGRAGRTGPGHCYRLYSSAVFEHHFPAFAAPEITRVPIEGVVLQMKAMHLDAVVRFPFPTPPDPAALARAERALVRLGALAPPPGTHVTALGRAMALFPLAPRFAKMLANGRQRDCLPYVVAVVAALSVGDPFLREEALEGDEDEEQDVEGLEHITGEAARAKEMRRLRRRAFFESQHTHGSLGDFTSDIFRVLSVVGAYEYSGGGHAFCAEHFVRPKAMEEIHKLRAQISHIAQANFPGTRVDFTPQLRPPNALQIKVLRQLLASAFIDQVAVRKDLVSSSADSGAQHATAKGVAYCAMDVDEDVFVHPSSLLAGRAPPDYVVFSEIMRTSRVWMKGLTIVNPAWLPALGKPALCTFSKPVKNMDGQLMVIPRFGPGWELPAIPAEKAT